MNTSNFQNNVSNKWIALSAGLAITTVGAIAPSAEAATFSLNFDEGANGGNILYNSDGTLQGNQWADTLGVTISANSNRSGSVGLLNTYDTDRSGRDNDLRTGGNNRGTVSQGNVLIIQEELGENISGGKYVADDEGSGGTINFGFNSAIALQSFSMLDIDDNNHNDRNRITVTGTNADSSFDIDVDKLINDHKSANGNRQGSTFTRDGVTITQVGKKRGNNSMYQFDLDETYFASMRFNDVSFKYPGSGAISGIEWRTIDSDGPTDIPEPSVVGGLLMIGFVGVRKRLKSNKQTAEAV